MTNENKLFTTREVCQETGATYRQIIYWCDKGWVAGQPINPGSGYPRMFDIRQVYRIKCLYKASLILHLSIDDLAFLGLSKLSDILNSLNR